jgi:hypothetical protein
MNRALKKLIRNSLAAFLYTALIHSCSDSNNLSGTRVGTETTISAKLNNGEPAAFSTIKLAPHQKYPLKVNQALAEWNNEVAPEDYSTTYTSDTKGMTSVKYYNDELYHIEIYNEDSTQGFWADSVGNLEELDSIKLKPTGQKYVWVSFTPDPDFKLFVALNYTHTITELQSEQTILLTQIPEDSYSFNFYELNRLEDGSIDTKVHNFLWANIDSQRIGDTVKVRFQ